MCRVKVGKVLIILCTTFTGIVCQSTLGKIKQLFPTTTTAATETTLGEEVSSTAPPAIAAVVGSCTSDDDCYAKVRSRRPTLVSEGVELCQCYAASIASPFDECERGDDSCRIGKCLDSCQFTGSSWYEAYCADDTKMCSLKTSSAAGCKVYGTIFVVLSVAIMVF